MKKIKVNQENAQKFGWGGDRRVETIGLWSRNEFEAVLVKTVDTAVRTLWVKMSIISITNQSAVLIHRARGVFSLYFSALKF